MQLNKTEHKIPTQEEHPIHRSLCHKVFYNKTHKARLKCEINYDVYKISPKREVMYFTKNKNKSKILKFWTLGGVL